MPKLKPTVADLVAVAAVLLLALGTWLAVLPGSAGSEVEISVADRATERYRLTEAHELRISSRGVDLTVVIDGGEVYVAEATCEDGVCLATGRISRSGESIICAPAGVAVRIVGGEANVDGIVG